MEKPLLHIVSLLGGKDSTAMLLRMIEEDELLSQGKSIKDKAFFEGLKARLNAGQG